MPATTTFSCSNSGTVAGTAFRRQLWAWGTGVLPSYEEWGRPAPSPGVSSRLQHSPVSSLPALHPLGYWLPAQSRICLLDPSLAREAAGRQAERLRDFCSPRTARSAELNLSGTDQCRADSMLCHTCVYYVCVLPAASCLLPPASCLAAVWVWECCLRWCGYDWGYQLPRLPLWSIQLTDQIKWRPCGARY